MPTLLLNRAIALPVGLLRQALETRIPGIGWRVGDEDMGGKLDVATLDRAQTILGRPMMGQIDDGIILISVELHHAPHFPVDGHAPPSHRLHVAISRPSTDDDDAARRIALVVGATLAIEQDERARLQLEPGGSWLDTTDMRTLLRAMDSDPQLRALDVRGPAECFNGTPPAAPFTNDDAVVAPHQDLPVPPPRADPIPLAPPRPVSTVPHPMRRVGSFGRKGL